MATVVVNTNDEELTQVGPERMFAVRVAAPLTVMGC